MRWAHRGAVAAFAAALIAASGWSIAAAYYAARGPAWLGSTFAALVAAGLAACILTLPWRWGVLWGLGICGAVLAWWLGLSPSNARDWEPEYAVSASVRRNGNRIVLTNIRNATYSPSGAISPAYYDAEYQLDQLSEVDLVSSYWSSEAIAHVFLSFGFSDGRHVAISVETRRERGEVYSVLAGFFRRYELIYVVADERDLIGVRTDIRRESVYLYQLQTTPAERQRLLVSYLDRIAELATAPEFYNTLVNNCTTNVVGRANAASGNIALSWMVLLSGYADRYAYELGRLDDGLPFVELKRRSLIRRGPSPEIGPDFSAAIRRGLSG
jgi:hypothetical protein